MKRAFAVLLLSLFATLAWAVDSIQECGKVPSAKGGDLLTVAVLSTEGLNAVSFKIGSGSTLLSDQQCLIIFAMWEDACKKFPGLKINEGQTLIFDTQKSFVKYSQDVVQVGAIRSEGSKPSLVIVVNSIKGNGSCFVDPKDFKRCSHSLLRATSLVYGKDDPGPFKPAEPVPAIKPKASKPK